MNVTWDKVNPGDFFFIEMGELGSLLYQKIAEKNGYNAVLLNSGELCYIYPSDKENYNKVTVTFSIHND